MELLVNSLIGMVLLVFDVIRGLFEWGDKALLTGAAVAAGAYLGTRAAISHRDDRTLADRDVTCSPHSASDWPPF